MNDCREDFWNALDELVNSPEIVIDRPKGSTHSRFPNSNSTNPKYPST